MEIRNLTDHPCHANTLATWFMSEWPDYYAGRDPADVAAEFTAAAGRDSPEVRLVALEENRPVGTVALSASSIPTHAHLTPWLGGLYVSPTHRGRGVANSLVQAAVDESLRRSIETLHTAVRSHAASYVRRGWTVIDHVHHGGDDLTVLQLWSPPISLSAHRVRAVR